MQEEKAQSSEQQRLLEDVVTDAIGLDLEEYGEPFPKTSPTVEWMGDCLLPPVVC